MTASSFVEVFQIVTKAAVFIFPLHPTLKTETVYVDTSTSLTIYQNTRRHILKTASLNICTLKRKGKSVPLQAWSGPEGSRKLRFPNYVTTAQNGGKVVSLTHRPPLSHRKYSWYSFLLEAESTPGP